jgi:GntR family transcriptional regulator/MocR family aminotransferase
MREVSRSAPAQALGYGDPRGERTLREVLAGYLRRVRGAVTDPERIIVCAGFAQGANLALRTLARRGARRVALEDPGDVDPALSAHWWGLEGVPVNVDELGVDASALARSGADAVVLTPAHQSPTGVVLGPGRRQDIAAWAQERGATILEDDYDAEFRYDRDPIGALQGLAPAHVALLGTVSKSLAPAMRLGWIVCPPGLVEEIADAKELDDRGSPGLDQLALATLIQSGRYDRHLRAMRARYASKRAVLIDALATHAPEVELRGLAAGFHAVARLPEDSDERAIADEARSRSVGLYPMSDLTWTVRARPPELVIGFGDLSEPAIRRGIETVADLLRGP